MIKILAAVYDMLINDSSVSAIVSNKIFPNVIPDKDNSGSDIKYPAIVTTRTELTKTYTKGVTCSQDAATVEIVCYAESYTEVIDLAEAVLGAVENTQGEYAGVTLTTRTRMVSVVEGYSNNAYYQSFVFSFK